MSNRQLTDLAEEFSLDSRDLLVVADRSKLTTNKIDIGTLSDALNGTHILSASYSVTSSFTLGNTISTSMAIQVISSSQATFISGSKVFAISSSYTQFVENTYTPYCTFEITSSGDSTGITELPRGNGSIIINQRTQNGSSGGTFLFRCTNHTDKVGSKIIGNISSPITFNGFVSGNYDFEISKITTDERKIRLSVPIYYENPQIIHYDLITYFYSGGASSASGSSVFSISSSYSSASGFSFNITSVTSASAATVTYNSSGSNTSAISASLVSSSFYAQKVDLAYSSSNGPLTGMIMIYAGIRPSSSAAWYNCDGNVYSLTESNLSASLGAKFSDGTSLNRLPKISSNLNSGSGPYNGQLLVENNIFGMPTNNQISQSYGSNSIIASYIEGTVYGPSIGSSGSAFYYNIRR